MSHSYVIHSGWAQSVNDSQRHYIPFRRLVELSGVPNRLAITKNAAQGYGGFLIHVYPRHTWEGYQAMKDEMKRLEMIFDKIGPMMDKFKEESGGKPYDHKNLDCPVCGKKKCLRLAWSGPRAAMMICQTKNCVRMMS